MCVCLTSTCPAPGPVHSSVGGWVKLAPAAVNNYYTRSLLGEATYHVREVKSRYYLQAAKRVVLQVKRHTHTHSVLSISITQTSPVVLASYDAVTRPQT